MKSECQHGRHNRRRFAAGRGSGALFCLAGEVEICLSCKVITGGRAGSEYLNGRSLLSVVERWGRVAAVFVRTLSAEQRQQMVRSAERARRSLDAEPSGAWSS